MEGADDQFLDSKVVGNVQMSLVEFRHYMVARLMYDMFCLGARSAQRCFLWLVGVYKAFWRTKRAQDRAVSIEYVDMRPSLSLFPLFPPFSNVVYLSLLDASSAD